MVFIKRTLQKKLEKTQKGVLLLGPRQTGKSTLINHLNPDLSIDFIHEPTFLEFAQNPDELENRIERSHPKTVFIDEIQRLPSYLNTIQYLIDSRKSLQFYLSGSSARKLRRGKANLLPGRVFVYYLGGLCAKELSYQFELNDVLAFGTLPGVYTLKNNLEKKKLLMSYSSTYLKEEIQAEALTRNLEGFARYLKIIANYSGRTIDFSKISSLAQIPRQSAVRYFDILLDTLIAHKCEVFTKSLSVKMTSHPKIYFFDTGVLNSLLNSFDVSEDRKGLLFENLIFNQMTNSAHSLDKEIEISFFRTEGGSKVDFILEIENEVIAIEAKNQKIISSSDLNGLFQFRKHFNKKHKAFVWYTGTTEKKMEGIEILPWQKGLKEIGL